MKWFPVNTAWRVLRLKMEERPLIWSAAANILNKTGADSGRGVVLQLRGWARC
jgi:hypothetical protein